MRPSMLDHPLTTEKRISSHHKNRVTSTDQYVSRHTHINRMPLFLRYVLFIHDIGKTSAQIKIHHCISYLNDRGLPT